MHTQDKSWNASQARHIYNPKFVKTADHIADAARTGDWLRVFELSEFREDWANSWRIGGKSWFTPLHQAAWRGAPVGIVRRLLDGGSWRALPTRDGKLARDIAYERGHAKLARELDPPKASMDRAEELAAVDRHLEQVIRSRLSEEMLGDLDLRFPVTRVMTEFATPYPNSALTPDGSPSCHLSVPIPGMYGGFYVTLLEEGIGVDSWSRVAGGSGQRHFITRDGAELIAEGFV